MQENKNFTEPKYVLTLPCEHTKNQTHIHAKHFKINLSVGGSVAVEFDPKRSVEKH